MEYDKIILEMLSRIKDLEEKVKELEGTAKCQRGKTSNKYRHLTTYLESANSPVRLTFKELEKIIGFELPSSAYKHREFWANTKSHSIALSWLSVGYKTVEVSIENEYVIFEN